ncbi:protein of unknown function DUF1115 [Kalmanozyma brasiliensis GHG001]|uniref:Small nuclear ribonucleoprotein Prp3 C-terminal domain-containing protein n=1 Tax=Kalmanozyma brasiliensis (strain GHG001) TaxID=1365824 RepID=V5EHG7_KALBG|nr:protein of unknown function DUF1115 [Kalmanozyma brasiliensis GHG001]EST10026.1 protein of unknown function DUF1115 [Kalmanozyma brasiliensis GHG001]
MVSSSVASPLLTLRYASLDDVAQDLDMVIQSCSEGEWAWDGASESEREGWQQFVQDPTSMPRSKVAGLAGKLQVAKGFSLSFALLSQSQDDGKEQKATVDVSAPTLSPEEAAKIKTALQIRSKEWQQDGIESLFLFDLLTTTQTLVADLPDQSQAETLDKASSEARPSKPSQAAPKHIELSRALFWSHHLKAPSKLKDFNNWCPELGIWGIVRVGYPGYLCFEGETSAVDEMVRRVKGLQWHAIQLRVQTAWNWTGEQWQHKESGRRSPMEQALLSCALAKGHPDNAFADKGGEGKVRTGCQMIENLGELVTRLKECGLAEDEIETVLGIHISG